MRARTRPRGVREGGDDSVVIEKLYVVCLCVIFSGKVLLCESNNSFENEKVCLNKVSIISSKPWVLRGKISHNIWCQL